MAPPLLDIPSSAALPASADVVVIGGGIVGVCTAYYLAKRGVSVALLEKGKIGAEQSSRNWGWCRQQNRDARELPMATKSLTLWDNFAAEIGVDTSFRRCGLLYLSNDDKELANWAKWRDFAITQNVETHMLTAEQARKRGAATQKAWKGGVFSPSDGTADPSRAAPAIALGVMKYGGSVHQGCAARGIERSAGRVSGVVTEAGTIRTGTVVMAGGAWASSFCHQMGINFPQSSVRSPIVMLKPGAKSAPAALHTSAISMTRRGDGGYTLAVSGRACVDPTPQNMRYAKDFLPMFFKRRKSLSVGSAQGWLAGHETRARWRLDAPTPMERNRILNPRPRQSDVDHIVRLARELVPEMRDIAIGSTWAGYIDSTPDGIPVISDVESIPGFHIAAGFSGHGFGIGPGAGHLVADLITGAPNFVDAQPYSLSRLSHSAWNKVTEY